MITQPLLAAKKPVLENLKFPLLATPKIDGIRCIKVNGQALSRSFKPIPNHHIRQMIEKYCPDGFDGEILCGAGFNDVQSMVMTREGTPTFRYLVFDYVSNSLTEPYVDRMKNLMGFCEQNPMVHDVVDLLIPTLVNNLDELKDVMERHLAEGHEGTMIRTPSSPYKCGRASLKEGYLTAIKYFVDDEAEIYGFQEQMTNNNVATQDVFGHKERSSHKENMVPANTLGAILARKADGTEFKIGTGLGLTQALRKEIWDNQDKYLGKIVHFRYQPHGVKDKPRIPSFFGFRHQDDMS